MIDRPRIAPVDIPTGTYALPFGLVAIVGDLPDERITPRGIRTRCPLTKFMICACWSCAGRRNPFADTPPAAYP